MTKKQTVLPICGTGVPGALSGITIRLSRLAPAMQGYLDKRESEGDPLSRDEKNHISGFIHHLLGFVLDSNPATKQYLISVGQWPLRIGGANTKRTPKPAYRPAKPASGTESDDPDLTLAERLVAEANANTAPSAADNMRAAKVLSMGMTLRNRQMPKPDVMTPAEYAAYAHDLLSRGQRDSLYTAALDGLPTGLHTSESLLAYRLAKLMQLAHWVQTGERLPIMFTKVGHRAFSSRDWERLPDIDTDKNGRMLMAIATIESWFL